MREVARDTLKKILLSLGTPYFHLMVKEMKGVLQRGYQLHVLGFTVHAMLEGVQDGMKAGDLDASVGLLMEVCFVSISVVYGYIFSFPKLFFKLFVDILLFLVNKNVGSELSQRSSRLYVFMNLVYCL